MGRKYKLSKRDVIKISEIVAYNVLQNCQGKINNSKNLEDNRKPEEAEDSESIKNDTFSNIKYCLKFFICPWSINKSLKKNNSLIEDVITWFVSCILEIIGSVGWLFSIIGIGWTIYICYCRKSSDYIILLGIFFLTLLVSVLLIVLGMRFSEEKDVEKIYLFSSTIMAILSFVVAGAALYWTIFMEKK